MKISVITPSYNQARFLQSTLDSVARQTLPPCEHLIYDPGSTDGSIGIARRHVDGHPAARLIVGQDRSQTHAINLGFDAARGDILCWLNSDDRYATEDVLASVAEVFAAEPDVDIVYGRGMFISPEGRPVKEAFVHRDAGALRRLFANALGILQPSLFMRRCAFDRAGPFDQAMNYSFDYEYWARCAAFGLSFRFLDKILSEAVIHDDAKTMRARGVSLAESLVVARRYYDFAALDWVRRVVDHDTSGADGIVTQGAAVDADALGARFLAENHNARALGRYFNACPTMSADTRQAFADLVLPTIRRACVSAWDANYFDMGMTLIASLHRHDPDRLLFVGDIGMTEDQRAVIGGLRNVVLLDRAFPSYSADWQRNPKNYVFKTIVFNTLAKSLHPGTALLWIDAGVALCRPIDGIFGLIERDGGFFVDHDDSRHWPLFNASFTSDQAIMLGRFTWREMAGLHVCSCLYGLRVAGPLAGLFVEAERLAHIEGVAVGDKHPPEAQKRKAKAAETRREQAARLAGQAAPVDDLDRLRDLFGYYGHRQDQSILSALVARYGAPVSSARHYCPASDESSVVSRENWFEGVSRKLGAFAPDPGTSGGVTFHHRGLVKDFSGLRFDHPRRQVCAIMGNGPSLAEVPLAAFDAVDTVGMNAAYRFWQTRDWYPTLYCCLDTVVGMSHREAILTMVRHRRRLGIRQFLIRRNLFDWLAAQGQTDGVICFDLIRNGFAELLPEPVTTGSHALAWAAATGYRRLVVAGVDCNYVETVQGAVKAADNTLEISEEAQNPNYFFQGYQQVGDRYNIPNPSKDLHLRSWRNVAARLPADCAVINTGAQSRMDAFVKMPLAEALTLVSVDGPLGQAAVDAAAALLAARSRGDIGHGAAAPVAGAPAPASPPLTHDPADPDDRRARALRLSSQVLIGQDDEAIAALRRLLADGDDAAPEFRHAAQVLALAERRARPPEPSPANEEATA